MATTAELIAQARIDLDDPELPGSGSTPDEDCRWSNAELLSYLNRAIDEACLRARLLVDSTNSTVCTIAVKIGKAVYKLDDRVLLVLRARLDSQDVPLEKKGRDDLDKTVVDWEAKTGAPSSWIQDMDSNTIQLVSIPVEIDVLRIVVQRTQMHPLTWAQRARQQPEMHRINHFNLLQWVLHLCYSKHDDDTYDETKAKKHGGMFSGVFGERPDAWNMEIQRASRPMRVPARFV